MEESRNDADSPKETETGTVYVLYRGKKMVASIKKNHWWIQLLVNFLILVGSSLVAVAVTYGMNVEKIQSLRDKVNLIDEVGSKPVRQIAIDVVKTATIVSEMKEQNAKEHTEIKDQNAKDHNEIKQTMIRIEEKIK